MAVKYDDPSIRERNPFLPPEGTPDLGDVGGALAGGENEHGLFNRGEHVIDPGSYQLPGFRAHQDFTSDQAYRALGLEQQYEVVAPGSPEWNEMLGQMSVEVAKGRMTLPEFQDFLKNGTRRAIPGATTAVAQPQDQFRTRQLGLADSLMGTIAGTTPSVAQQQLKMTTQGNIANAYAMGQAGRSNPAGAKMIADQAGNINQQAAGQGALLRANEIANAQGLMSGVLGQGRGQDIGNFEAQHRVAQGWSGQGLTAANIALQAQIERERQESTDFNAFQPIGAQAFSAAAGALSPFATMFNPGGGGGGAPGGGAGPAPSLYPGMAGPTYPNGGYYSNGSGLMSSPMPGMARGGEVGRRVMGDTACSGCGNLNSDCTCYKRMMAHGGQVMGDVVCAGCGNFNSDCQCYKRMLAGGGMVPGYAPGGAVDRQSADVVPAMLSPGEIVLPRSVTMADDPATLAAEFVAEIKKKRARKAA